MRLTDILAALCHKGVSAVSAPGSPIRVSFAEVEAQAVQQLIAPGIPTYSTKPIAHGLTAIDLAGLLSVPTLSIEEGAASI